MSDVPLPHFTISLRQAKTAIAGYDALGLTTPAFVGFGNISDTKAWFSRMILLLVDLDIPKTPTLFASGYYWGESDAHSIHSRAGLSAEALQLLKMWKLTFNEVETTAELFDTVIKYFGFRTEKYAYSTPEFLVNQMKRRHWLLAPSEINLDNFKAWLPPPAPGEDEPVDFTGMSTSLLCDGDTAEVFEMLAEYANAVTAANVDIQLCPFNPFLQSQSYAALGRCNSKLKKNDEARAAFEKSVAHASRCRIKLMQLFYLQDYISSGLAPEGAVATARDLSDN